MADIVENVLKAEAEKEQTFKSIEVAKAIDPCVDLGNLLVEDVNSYDNASYHQSRDQCLLDMARDSAQILFNKVWELPTGEICLPFFETLHLDLVFITVVLFYSTNNNSKF